jgi:uncharacterized DUF497 family protein
MRFVWDENKNLINIQVHGIDFCDVWMVFEYPMLTKVDTRKNYKEERLVGLGQLYDAIIVVVFTYREKDLIRVISIRRANRNERKVYQEKFGEPN